MTIYMVEVQLPINPTKEFYSLIPSQRQIVAELMSQRKILNYTVSADRTRLWIVARGNNEQEVRDILSRQPMDKFFQYDFFELMFHESTGQVFPIVSLN